MSSIPLSALLALGACAASALAQFSPVLQERSNTTQASVTSGASDNDMHEALSFVLFDRTTTSGVTGAGGANANATSIQTSSFASAAITGTLSARSDARTGTTFVVGDATAQSSLLFIFNLTAATPVEFTATGAITLVGVNPDGEPSDLYGYSRVRLLNAVTEEMIAGFLLGPGAQNTSAHFGGTLNAGQYAILAYTESHTYSADLVGPPNRSGSGESSLSFSFAVPSPECVADVDNGTGAGTPDGGVTIDDLLYFLVIFEAGSLDADVDDGSGTGTLDGGVTIDDLLYFLLRFEAGC